jgi:peptide/nickel transport system substrate-binding protein
MEAVRMASIASPKRKAHGAALTGIAALALGLGACSSAEGGADSDDSVLRIGLMVEAPTYDPAGAGTGQNLAPYFPVYDTLLAYDQEGLPSGNLARDFEWNDDNTALTLFLEEGIEFSDGAPFDADAVKANIEHFQSFSGGVAGPVLQYVESVEVSDEHTVVLNLSAPDPALPAALARPAGLMGSPEALGSDEISEVPVGTGPYILDADRSVTGSEAVFVRNDEYWKGAVPYSELRLLVLADESARLNALRSGQIDVGHVRLPANAVEAEENGLIVDEQVSLWEGLFFLDRDGEMEEPIGDPRVREALRIAIDVDAMIDTIRLGYGEATSQIFPETADAYVEELDEYYEYDPDRARDLLEEAGYPDGFTFSFPRTGTISSDYYVAIEQYWSEIGVTAEPYQWAQGEALPSMQGGDFAVVYFSNILQDSWSTANFSVAPDSRYNAFETEDSAVDALLETMQYGDEEERAEAGQDLNRHLLEEAWFGPLYRVEEFVISSPEVELTMTPGYPMPTMTGYKPAE